MRTIQGYHEEEDLFQSGPYLLILFLLGIFLVSLFSVQIDLTLPLSFMKTENGGYQAYLSEEQISRVQENGVFYTRQGEYHYTRQLIPDSQMIYENMTFTLVNFQLREECQDSILSGRVLISRNTVFDRIINLWKEEL